MYGWERNLTQKDPKNIGYQNTINSFVDTRKSHASIITSKLIFQDTRPYDIVILKVSLNKKCFEASNININFKFTLISCEEDIYLM